MNNSKANRLALAYAREQDENVLRRLLFEVRELVEREATKWEQQSSIPREYYRSAFYEAVWEAARKYEELSNFSQRLHFFFKRAGTDVYRYHTCKKRSVWVEEHLASLDSFDGDQMGMADIFGLDQFEEKVAMESALQKTLEDFGKVNERDGRIVSCLYAGLSNEEIARILGEDSYNAKIRKRVQRAKERFGEYLVASDVFEAC